MNQTALVKELRDETLPLVPLARLALENARNTGQAQDVGPVRELLHKVAGTAAPVGFPQLSRLARFGEELAVLVLTGDAKTSDATLTLLGRVLDAVEAELNATLTGSPAPAPTPSAPSDLPELNPVTRTGPGPRPEGVTGEKPQVLMVDGDIVSVKLFGKVLTDHGFELKSVKGGEATRLLEEGFGDVLLLDVASAVTDSARAMVTLARPRRIPIVAMSKLARDHEAMAAFAKDVDEFLTKPIAPEVMVAKVRALAERRRAVRAARSRAPTALNPGLKAAPVAPVLVVDDSRVIRGLVREFLAESKIEVVEAEDGSEALKLLEGLERPPAAAVIDMQMPVLDGLGLTRALRALEKMKGLPIVLLSAQDDPGSQQAATEAGANAFLVKQKFDAPELRKALRAAGMAIDEPK